MFGIVVNYRGCGIPSRFRHMVSGDLDTILEGVDVAAHPLGDHLGGMHQKGQREQ